MASKRTFSCPKCGAKFPWQDGYVNRRVGCKCGAVFEAFEDLPEELAVDPYAVVEEPAVRPIPKPSPVGAIGHAAAAGGGTAQKTMAGGQAVLGAGRAGGGAAAQLAAYPGKSRVVTQVDEGVDETSPWLNLFLPAGLLLAGIGLIVGQGAIDPRGDATSLRSVAVNVMFLGIMIVTMLAGGAVASVLMGLEFGSIGKVAWKFAAIATFAAGVAVVVAGLDPEPLGMRGKAIAWNMVIVVYWICFHAFFALDLQENLMTVAIIGLMQAAVGCILLSV